MAQTIHCGCDNGGDAAKYQDKTYGKGNRLFTEKKNGNRTCTVCGKESAGHGGTVAKSNKKK